MMHNLNVAILESATSKSLQCRTIAQVLFKGAGHAFLFKGLRYGQVICPGVLLYCLYLPCEAVAVQLSLTGHPQVCVCCFHVLHTMRTVLIPVKLILSDFLLLLILNEACFVWC